MIYPKIVKLNSIGDFLLTGSRESPKYWMKR